MTPEQAEARKVAAHRLINPPGKDKEAAYRAAWQALERAGYGNGLKAKYRGQ